MSDFYLIQPEFTLRGAGTEFTDKDGLAEAIARALALSPTGKALVSQVSGPVPGANRVP